MRAKASRAEVGRAEALGVGVEDPERVGVPEGEEELAHRLADRVDREAVARPGLLGGQVVPAEGVGAVGGDHVPGLDHVALALRHLLALGVEDQAEADAVAVAGGVEEQGRLGEQRVEPAAGLVDRLADEVGREALLEQLLVLERVVELGEGHRAAVVPGVDHRLDPAHLPPALGAVEDDLVDVGAVQVLGDLAAGALAQLGDRAGAEAAVAVLAGALPDRQRRAPVAVAGERPVDVVLEPFAEAAVLDVLRVPADRLVVGEQLGRGPARWRRTSSTWRSRGAACRSASSAGRRARRPARGRAGRGARGRRSAPAVTSGSLTKRPSKPLTTCGEGAVEADRVVEAAVRRSGRRSRRRRRPRSRPRRRRARCGRGRCRPRW